MTKYLNIQDILLVIWVDNGHTSEHYFKCTYCENDFRQKSGCKIHVLTHTGGDTFICKISENGFTQVHPLWKVPCAKQYFQSSRVKAHRGFAIQC